MQSGFTQAHKSSFCTVYRLIDSVLVFASLYFACWSYDISFDKNWLFVGLLASVLFTFFAESFELYRSWRSGNLNRLFTLTFLSWIPVCCFLLLLAYFSKHGRDYSRVVVGSWFILVMLSLLGWRGVLHIVLRKMRISNINTRSAAIIGVSGAGVRLAAQLTKNPQLGIRLNGVYSVAGIEEDVQYCQLGSLSSCVGTADEVVKAACAGELDIVYIALPMRHEKYIVELLDALADSTATVHLVPDFLFSNLMHSRWQQVGDALTLSIYDTPVNGLGVWLKRIEDLVLSTIILALISPVLFFVAIAIKLTSEGPVIFKQRRYGLDGRPIQVCKFRSMTVQDNGDKVVQASKGDARITRVGAFLRRTSLDELPQFLNVMQGSMSIVGPRPHAVAHNEEYRALVQGYMLRHKVKPGITGWAQINGWRGETDTLEKMRKRVEFDLHYINHWSVWFDVKIIFITVFKGFVHKNAY